MLFGTAQGGGQADIIMGRTGLLLISALLATGSASGQTFTYDAALGTLPSDQGWTHFVNDPPPFDGLTEANYTVSGGVLTQGDTGGPNSDIANTQHYALPPAAFDYDTNVVVVDLALRIGFSTLTAPGASFPRAGFGFSLVDDDGELLHLFIGGSSLFLLGENNAASALVVFDTTSAFHDYQVEVDAIGATLLVDGVPEAFLDRADFRIVGGSSRFFVGDTTILQRSSSDLESFSVAVPEPAVPSGLIAGTLALAGLNRRRKRHVRRTGDE